MKKVLLLIAITISGCTQSYSKYYRVLSKEDHSTKRYLGHYKIGSPYKINGTTYHPKQISKYDTIGMASWYGNKEHNKKTANGDVYNNNLLTAASPILPLPSMIKVTNIDNNKSLILMVNDRGPYAGNRILDVSEKAATLLEFRNKGTAKIRIQYLHEETQKLRQKLSLPSQHGASSTDNIKDPHCSVNCHIQLTNIKHKLLKAPSITQKT